MRCLLKVAGNAKNHYGFIAVALILCTILSLVMFMFSGSNASGVIQPGETSSTPTVTEAAPTLPPTAENQTNDANPTLISEEEALALAMPVIEKYASENNRTITSVTASLNEIQDFEGSRGGHSLGEVTQNPNLSPASSSILFPCFPVWHVEVHFIDINYVNYRTVPLTDNTTCTLAEKTNFPTGLLVSVWADTGTLGTIGHFY